MNMELFRAKIEQDGWVVFENALPAQLLADMRADSLKWVDICKGYQVRNGINSAGDGTAHHAIGAKDSIDRFVAMHLFHDYVADFFGGIPYIMHACNPVGGFPNYKTYLHQVHRDAATYIPGFRLRMNMLVMLDDFTEENGATQILPGSQNLPERPDDATFDAGSQTILGSAGSVVLFNSYLWHKGGPNRTDRNRVALTLSFGPAFVKPQMDYARLLGEAYGKNLDELTRQVLGYNARVPVSLDEWYRPRTDRLYQANQG